MIKILCVGKIKEKFYRDAIDEYMKRLSKYHKIIIDEVIDNDKAVEMILSANNSVKIKGDKLFLEAYNVEDDLRSHCDDRNFTELYTFLFED